ncbi:hypothetical protein Sjap_008734 [Stephania japonica]|uniref:Uncharacterized protein n=1 Tax=Stephania japonica TaxID=461633 RepID=A0AAP0JQY4_9MAGN
MADQVAAKGQDKINGRWGMLADIYEKAANSFKIAKAFEEPLLINAICHVVSDSSKLPWTISFLFKRNYHKRGPRKDATKVVLVNGVMKKLLLFLSYDFKTQVMKHFLPHLLKGPQTLAVKVVLKLFPSPSSEGVIPSSPSLKVFYFKDLKKATRNFGCDSILGEGGCGRVFKGWLDKHTLSAFKPAFGMVVAIKKDKPKGFLDRNEWLEFNPKLLASRLARKDHCIEDAYTTFMDYIVRLGICHLSGVRQVLTKSLTNYVTVLKPCYSDMALPRECNFPSDTVYAAS